MSIGSGRRKSIIPVIEFEEDDEDAHEEEPEEKPKVVNKKSVEVLDTQVSSLHQDVATLSLEVRNAIHALQEMTYSTIQSQMNLNSHLQPARSIPNLPNDILHAHHEPEMYMTRSSSQPAEIWGRSMTIDHVQSNPAFSDFGQSSPSLKNCAAKTTQTQTDNVIDYETLENLVLSNPQLVLNILGINAHIQPPHIPIAFPQNAEPKPVNLSVLTTIPEAISADPSYHSLHELASSHSKPDFAVWNAYDDDQTTNKSTETLIENPEASISFTVIKENIAKGSNASLQQMHQMQQIQPSSVEEPLKQTASRRSSNKKNSIKGYEQFSTESLADSHGYLDDFDESCALINDSKLKKLAAGSVVEGVVKRTISSSKCPLNYRFSAGDADKIEKGMSIKNLPSTRSLRDS